jgi:hypothetical protein
MVNSIQYFAGSLLSSRTGIVSDNSAFGFRALVYDQPTCAASFSTRFGIPCPPSAMEAAWFWNPRGPSPRLAELSCAIEEMNQRHRYRAPVVGRLLPLSCQMAFWPYSLPGAFESPGRRAVEPSKRRCLNLRVGRLLRNPVVRFTPPSERIQQISDIASDLTRCSGEEPTVTPSEHSKPRASFLLESD